MITTEQEHVLGADGQFHVEDEAVDLAQFGFEDWAAFALFWVMAAVVFYQVYTRYVLEDSAGWTEEIARYFLVAVVFVGAHGRVALFHSVLNRTGPELVEPFVDELISLVFA